MERPVPSSSPLPFTGTVNSASLFPPTTPSRGVAPAGAEVGAADAFADELQALAEAEGDEGIGDDIVAEGNKNLLVEVAIGPELGEGILES
jgi:hypothetical protein